MKSTLTSLLTLPARPFAFPPSPVPCVRPGTCFAALSAWIGSLRGLFWPPKIPALPPPSLPCIWISLPRAWRDNWRSLFPHQRARRWTRSKSTHPMVATRGWPCTHRVRSVDRTSGESHTRHYSLGRRPSYNCTFLFCTEKTHFCCEVLEAHLPARLFHSWWPLCSVFL